MGNDTPSFLIPPYAEISKAKHTQMATAVFTSITLEVSLAFATASAA